MKTQTKFPRRGLALLSAVIACSACASAFAGSTETSTVANATARQVTTRHAACYTRSIVSGIPVRCDRFGGIPTTMNPIIVVGRPAANGSW